MTSRIVSLLSLGLLVCAGSATAGAWSALPPLNPARYGAAAAATGDTLFFVGGANAGGNLTDVDTWDGGSGSWSTAPALPANRSSAGVAPIGMTVLAVGGFEDSGFPSTGVSRFDPSTGVWSGAAALPAGCAAMGCATLNGRVYVAGGETDYGALSTQSLRYDPVANTWSPIAALPTPRSGPAAAVFNGRLYVIGGAVGTPVATVEAYDPVANAWSPATALPEALWAPAAAMFAGRIWVMGGFDASFNPTAHVYSMGTDGAWRAETALPVPCAQLSAGALGNLLVIAGGVNGLGEPTGAAYAMAADATPPAETLHVSVTINPATLNRSSQGEWLTVILQSEWLISRLDLTTVTLDGVALDLGAPQTINADQHVLEVKVSREPFTHLSVGIHELMLAGRTVEGTPVSGHAALKVIGVDASVHAPRAKLTPVSSGTGQTAVTVTLDQPAMTTLDVVDVQGRVVDRIESGYRPAGSYSVTWPASGQAVRSGLYFVRVRAAGAMAMTRLVVSH